MTIMLLGRQLLWHTCIYAHNHTFFTFQKTRCNGSETLPRKKQKQFLTYKKKILKKPKRIILFYICLYRRKAACSGSRKTNLCHLSFSIVYSNLSSFPKVFFSTFEYGKHVSKKGGPHRWRPALAYSHMVHSIYRHHGIAGVGGWG